MSIATKAKLFSYDVDVCRKVTDILFSRTKDGVVAIRIADFASVEAAKQNDPNTSFNPQTLSFTKDPTKMPPAMKHNTDGTITLIPQPDAPTYTQATGKLSDFFAVPEGVTTPQQLLETLNLHDVLYQWAYGQLNRSPLASDGTKV